MYFGVWGHPRAPEKHPRAPKRPPEWFPTIGQPEIPPHFRTILGFSFATFRTFAVSSKTPYLNTFWLDFEAKGSENGASGAWLMCVKYGKYLSDSILQFFHVSLP